MTRKRSALHAAPALHGVGASPLSLRRLSPRPVQWLAGLFTGLLVVGAAFANPTGPDVVHGNARLTHPGPGALHVTTSPDTIINWQGFSIGTGEVTRFIQQTTASAVLNRVTGTDPSAILGRLLSNGRVFLVNPHGIVFGEGAVVDTVGLVASTLDIGDADFRAGRYRFDAGPEAGGIVNRGLIKAGAGGVFLLAPSIESSGVVRTAGGDLVLAAGRRITLTSLDLDGVRVEVQAPEDEALNLGALIAERGAAGVFAGTLRNAGTVEASAVEVGEDGVVRLVAQGGVTLEAGGRVAAEGRSGGTVHVESEGGTTWVSGEVSARGREGRGGAIRLLGERVGLAGARVDASGPAGGGEVLVGGDVSGEGPVPRAGATYVSADSTVAADALGAGDGGKVVVFAEGFANVQGRLSARGGPFGGDGGFVETSGLGSFAIGHTPDTTAPGGEGGHWLIDPNDIEIVGGGGNVNIDINSVDPFVSADDNARLGIDLLVAALSGGQSVTVRTTESGANSQSGDITLNTPIGQELSIESTTGTNTLTIDAHRHININRPITDAAGGAELHLVLEADGEIRFRADVTLRGGSLETRGGDSTHVTNGAQVTLDGITWTVNNDNGLDIGTDGSGMVLAQNGAEISAGGRRIRLGNNDQHLGDGTLTIESGTGVTAEEIYVGDHEGSKGTVKVTGSGSTLTTTSTDIGNLFDGILVGVGGTGTLTIESGADVTAHGRIYVGALEGSEGTVKVTGSGSTLTTTGTDNTVRVGDEGTGTLEVLDGGLVETLWFDVGRTGVGRAVIRGVAADGSRSRVMVSPAGGKFSGVYADTGGAARVGRHAGSRGTLEILEGGLLQVRDSRDTHGPGFQMARNKGSTGTLLIDGPGSSLEVIQDGPAVLGNPRVSAGPYVTLGRRGGGTTTIRNGGRLWVQGEQAFVQISKDSVYPPNPDPDTGPIDQQSVVAIQSGGAIEVDGEGANFVIGNSGPAADGVVTVSGSGSTLTTTGTDNEIIVGDEGTGTLEVLDGGLVETLKFDVGRSGVGRAVIRGVAADGSRSRVMVSPAGGKYSGDFADEGGFARVGRNAGSRGALEILEGGLLQVRDGRDTHGPGLQVARNKGSTGTLLIDGPGSSLEVIQDGPVDSSDPDFFGPYAQLGRRGGGTTTIRNGGRLRVQGEAAFVGVSQDSVSDCDGRPCSWADPDTGPIDQQSVVAIQSGGAIEVDGEGASFVIGDSGPAADGVVTVSGSGSTLTTTGTDNRIWVGDEGTGTLEVLDGGLVETSWFDVGRSGVGRAVIRGVAADGSRSRVMVSPAGGKFSGVYADEGGFVGVGRAAGSRGTLEILEGGLLQVRDGRDTHGPGFQMARNKGSTGTLLIDGPGSSLEVIQDSPAVFGNPRVSAGPFVQLGRRGGGTTTIRNGGRLRVQGEQAFVGISKDSVSSTSSSPDPDTGPIDQQSVVAIQSGGAIEVDGEGARFVIGDSGPAADGVVTVTGSGSTLTMTGTDNEIRVGDRGTGTLEVLDGGLVETLKFDVGLSGVGRAVIRGVAADGSRSRVMVSPAGGKFSGDSADQGGFARVGRNAGSRGTLEILEGGLLQVRDGRDTTHGPLFHVARNKGSTGTLLIDGPGSSLEVIQDGPVDSSDPDFFSPHAWLGRRGGGTTTIRNGGRLRVQGEQAFVGISRGSVNPDFPDTDTGPIDQQSVVAIQSGGAIEVDGEGARFVIGDSGPAADGVVTVTGSGSTLATTGTDNAITVGDEGTGALTIGSGGSVRAERVIVGRRPGSQGTLRVELGGELEAGTLLAIGKDFDFDTLTTREPGGTGSVVEVVGSRVRYGALEVGAGGTTSLELPLQVQEDVVENTDEILPAQPEGPTAPEIAEDPSADEEARARQEDEGEQDEGDAEEEEAGEETVAGGSGEDEREELPMCPA